MSDRALESTITGPVTRWGKAHTFPGALLVRKRIHYARTDASFGATGTSDHERDLGVGQTQCVGCCEETVSQASLHN
jgi:hypothetical protein